MLIRSERPRLVIASFLLFIALGLSPIGIAGVVLLEERFPPWDASRGAPDGIIVLGGTIDPEISTVRGSIAIMGAAERVTVIAQLARRYPDARIVFTGGSAGLFGGPPEAAFVVRLFESFGIPPARVIIEDRARNTEENARFTKALVNPKPPERWLLVTSASHMPRAIGVFRKADFPVEAYPVDWRTRGWRDVTWSGSLLSGVMWANGAAYEWIGLLVYRLTGRTSEFFPGPR